MQLDGALGIGMVFRMMRDTVLHPPLGLPAPLLAGETIVGSASGAAGARLPAAGRVTLMYFQWAVTRESIAALRRQNEIWGYARFGVCGQNEGEFQTAGPYTYAEEKRVIADYFVKDLDARGLVVLEETQMRKRPAPDGRIIYDSTANEKAYKGVGIGLVGKDGKFFVSYGALVPAIRGNAREDDSEGGGVISSHR